MVEVPGARTREAGLDGALDKDSGAPIRRMARTERWPKARGLSLGDATVAASDGRTQDHRR